MILYKARPDESAMSVLCNTISVELDPKNNELVPRLPSPIKYINGNLNISDKKVIELGIETVQFNKGTDGLKELEEKLKYYEDPISTATKQMIEERLK